MCLSRQASWVYGPTMWDMPPAQLTEKACIANGDPYCEYHLKWFARRRLLPIVAGVALGGLAAFAVSQSGTHVPAEIAFPVLGAAIAYILELRRAQGTNLKLAGDMNQVLRDLGQAEAEARSELSALDRREKEWTRLMEEQMAARTMTLEKVVDGLELLQNTRATTLKGFSHDLRNPLFVLKGNVQYLLEKLASGNASLAEEKETLTDMEAASIQMEGMLGSLMDVAVQGPGQLKLAPKPLVTAPLADLFRRRLRALVYGRDIKITSFMSRDAPDKIVVDPLVFDRIVDNLLTNAAKYTRRGSIVLEIAGTRESDEFLTLKISDTGEGISQESIERIFRPRTADEPKRPNSYGVGLSSVVQLMAQIGGRIDVMSRVGSGSTFWAHFPAKMPQAKAQPSGGEVEPLESIIRRVVTVRKAEGS
jgi:signal transduction histidine kinase